MTQKAGLVVSEEAGAAAPVDAEARAAAEDETAAEAGAADEGAPGTITCGLLLGVVDGGLEALSLIRVLWIQKGKGLSTFRTAT